MVLWSEQERVDNAVLAGGSGSKITPRPSRRCMVLWSEQADTGGNERKD